MLFAASIDLEYVSGHFEMHITQKTTSTRKGLLTQQTSRTQHYDQTKPNQSCPMRAQLGAQCPAILIIAPSLVV